MQRHSSQGNPENTFTITQNENSISYTLNNPKELKAVEISSDLYRANFYFSQPSISREENEYKFLEEQKRIKGVVSSAVYPTQGGIGGVSGDAKRTEIYGMKDYASNPEGNRRRNEETHSIANQLHPLEWILTKARNSGVLPSELYDKIRIDVRRRVLQLQQIAKTNKDSVQQILDEVSKQYIPPANFKRIKAAADVNEFAGRIVAYISNSYYFSNGEHPITLPIEIQGQKIRFARVNNYLHCWEGGEKGLDMDCFLKPDAVKSTNALINARIMDDSELSMRLATIEELEFLQSLVELDQSWLEYRDKKNDIALLGKEIALRSNMLSVSQFSLFANRKSAVTPPFVSITTGAVDWPRETESKDKSVPPNPSGVYLIKGGDESSRSDKAYALARSEAFSMFAIYHNEDKSEYVVIFSKEHDTFNLMNFALAKKMAGEELLPDNFSINVFKNQPRFGVIFLNDVPELTLSRRNN